MKIAFVGKGGSGKTTLTGLFALHATRNDQTVVAVDADINMNLPGVLGVSVPHEQFIATPHNAARIYEYLRGSNDRIETTKKFVNTTPPGTGSNIWNIDSNASTPLDSMAVEFGGGRGKLMMVGSYETDNIASGCYHGQLGVLENVLSHTRTGADSWLVADMVAGTDAFAGTLHAQFDAVFVVVEPTPEGVGVARHYRELAEAANVGRTVNIVGNKIEDNQDLRYLEKEIDVALLGTLPRLAGIKQHRQHGSSLADMQSTDIIALMQRIDARARDCAIAEDDRLGLLYNLHRARLEKPWVKNTYGDLSCQIDPDFSFARAS